MNWRSPAVQNSRSWLRRRWRRIAVLFAAVLAPLWLFERLADEVREKEGFSFDLPILNALHRHATPALDAVALAVTHLGLYGTLAADVTLLAVLVLRRKLRNALYFFCAVGGAAVLNIIVKKTFARARPALWPSLAPEKTFSFPSGHAMASMALAGALIVLARRTTVAIPAGLGLGLFAFAVGLSRLYLGVHFPSDVLAAWAASVVWTVGLALLLNPAQPAAAASADGA